MYATRLTVLSLNSVNTETLENNTNRKRHKSTPRSLVKRNIVRMEGQKFGYSALLWILRQKSG